jgi:hypothetical protein
MKPTTKHLHISQRSLAVHTHNTTPHTPTTPPPPHPGDMCWGYDMANANSVGIDYDAYIAKWV